MTDLSIVAIIPLYNGAKWIEQSIRSVLSQTLKPNEIVVVDDGSTDDGAAIVAKVAEIHPIVLLRKPNGGQSSARNFGVAHSKSALIAFLDQDDAWYPHHLEQLVGPFREKQSLPLGWVYSNLDVVSESGDMFCRDFLNDVAAEQPKRHLVRCMAEDMHILPSASLILRNAFEGVGGFDEGLSGYEDDDLFLRMFCARWNNIYLPESLSYWRMNNMSCSNSPRMAMSRMIYARKLLAKYPDDQLRHMYFSRDFIAPKFFRLAAVDFCHAVQDKNRHAAKRALADMAEMIPYMHLKKRLLFTAAAPFLHWWYSARAAYQARVVLQPIIRRVLSFPV
jgi:glycosyltransferase involved in cell wall biosynthesis